MLDFRENKWMGKTTFGQMQRDIARAEVRSIERFPPIRSYPASLPMFTPSAPIKRAPLFHFCTSCRKMHDLNDECDERDLARVPRFCSICNSTHSEDQECLILLPVEKISSRYCFSCKKYHWSWETCDKEDDD